jgi:hypothetical protein
MADMHREKSTIGRNRNVWADSMSCLGCRWDGTAILTVCGYDTRANMYVAYRPLECSTPSSRLDMN